MKTLEQQKDEFVMIDARVSDSGDYDWLYEQGIQNTLRPYWDWAREAEMEVQFEVVYPEVDPSWGNRMYVVAKFENDIDRKDFIANHTWDLPKTVLKAESMFDPCFICDK